LNARTTSIFDLSFRGDVPNLLRSLAERIESKEVKADSFQWSMNADRCEFSFNLELHPKD
jgi:hypothetical protein